MIQVVAFAEHFKSRLNDFKAITKMGLSLSVVFSCISGYLLAAENIDISIILLLALGGYCMVGASNVFNQIIERELDGLMQRTKSRPIPMKKISIVNSFIIAVLLTLAGLTILYSINERTAMFAAVSIFIYTSVYTPLKQITPLSVFAGAIPGAIPFMLGWVACTGEFGIEPGVLFMIQFFWQFPHFWSIAWFLDDDYKKAGFKMLPTGEKDKGTAVQIIAYIIWTILICIAPAIFNTGRLTISNYAAVLIVIIGMIFLYYGFRLFKNQSSKEARKLMLVSILFLTSIQLIYVIDKFL
jgi:protoheme IX farnesyltransferase|tara:strand:+ start:567 stop:1460 length:894 start_codon:yes stop_codon:yes gene_type:complete